MRLKGRVAIITGAAAGIGRESALLFAREGAKIAAVDLDDGGIHSVVLEVDAAGGQALAVRADVSKAGEVQGVVRAVLDRFGRVDILFNNAGIVPQGKIHATSEAEWDRAMTVNVKSMYLLCHEVVPVFLRQGGGVILNTSSATALRSVPDRAVYSASKGAVLALTRSLAVQFAGRGVRTNAISPGPIETPLLMDWLLKDEAAKALRLNRNPSGRFGKPEEIVSVGIYLASDESRWTNGASLVVDGGISVNYF